MQTESRSHLRTLTVITCWVPPLAIALLSLLYFRWPQFYLRFIIERSVREYQAVETLTLVVAVSATVILFRSAMELWRLQSVQIEPGAGVIGKSTRTGAWLVGLCCLAMFFFTGEEMNWGQTFFHWGVPENQKPYEVNIHNSLVVPLTVMQFGDIFLLLFFVALPILWRFRDRFGLPEAWAPAIPPWAVTMSVIVSSLWEQVKYFYLALSPDPQVTSSEIYLNFLQELNEHKEMLFAFSFLMYGLFVRAHCRSSPKDPVLRQ